MNKRVLIFVAAACLALGQTRPASALERIIGALSPNGGAHLLKHFSVPAGSVIVGVEFVNNDDRTVFPKLSLLQGLAQRLADATVLAEATNVQGLGDHRAAVTFCPVVLDAAQDLYVDLELPASNGVRDASDGDGIGATQLSTSAGSYFIASPDDVFGVMDVDYHINIVFQGAAKATGGNSPAVPVQTFLRVGPVQVATSHVPVHFALGRPGRAELAIYNVAGQRVRLLANEPLTGGAHLSVWDTRDEEGRSVASGLYIARLRTADKVLSQKLVLTK